MLQVIVVSALASLAYDAEAVKNLSTAAEKLIAAESYKFEVTTKSEGGGFPGGGGPPGTADEPIKGAYQKAQPVHLKRGSTEVYRGDGLSLYKGEDGKWQKVNTQGGFGGRRGGDRPPGGGGGNDGQPGNERGRRGNRGGGGEGGDEGGEPGNEGGRGRRGNRDGGEGGGEGGEGRRGGRGGAPNPGMAAYGVNATQVPHAILLDIAKKVESVMAEKVGTKTLYVGKLTPAAALELSGGSSGRGNPPEASGTIRVTADSTGAIEKIELDSKTKFSFGEGREFERTRKTTVAISDVGKTKVDAPKEVTEQLKML